MADQRARGDRGEGAVGWRDSAASARNASHAPLVHGNGNGSHAAQWLPPARRIMVDANMAQKCSKAVQAVNPDPLLITDTQTVVPINTNVQVQGE